MRYLLFVAGFLCLLAVPATSFAATVQTDSWEILVSEDSNQRLVFSVEPIGQTQAPPTVVVQDPPPTDTTSPVEHQPMEGAEGEILINEFVSDPIPGEQEWIELYNPDGRAVDLSGWTILEGSGRTTELEGLLGPGDYHLLYSINGSLNNAGDSIALVDPFGNVIDEMVYGNWEDSVVSAARDPQSVGRNPLDPDQFLQMDATPGERNQEPAVEAASVGIEDRSDNSAQDDTPSQTDNETYDTDLLDDVSEDGHTECTPSESTASQDTSTDEPDDESEDQAPFTSLANIRTLELGSQLTTEGVVSVVPGVLGQQYFYLAGSGVQVYLYSAEFPLLERGDRIRVTGQLTEANGETRVKLSDATDITILGHEDAPEAHDVTGSQVGEATEGWLVRITGLVTEKSSDEFLLSDEEADIRVVIKDATGIAIESEIGDSLTVTGIVSQTRSGYRILPRDQQDLLPRTTTETSDAEQMVSAAAGMLGSSGSGGTGGWAVSIATVLSLAGGAAHYLYKQKKWLFA